MNTNLSNYSQYRKKALKLGQNRIENHYYILVNVMEHKALICEINLN